MHPFSLTSALRLGAFLWICFGLSSTNLFAQLTSEQELAIDQLLEDWKLPNHPGGVLSVAKEGEVLYQKGFGYASMRLEVPIEEDMIFNIASVSKQFTAMGILVMEQKGMLSIDDDVRKHLPELPDFGTPVTIRHMLNHTSGQRSMHSMLGLAGWRGNDVKTNEDHWRFAVKQRELSFQPGDDYNYCNTGYALAANVIERLSGQDFPSWMKENVFDPLGLQHTYVEDNYDAIVSGNAYSYRKTKEGFEKEVEVYGYYGSGNIHSTANDMHRWLKNFHAPQQGWERLFEEMKIKGVLNSGESINYGLGVSLDESLSMQRIQHGGAVAGFWSFVASYPAQELDVVVFCNYSGSDPIGISEGAARIVLGLTEEDVAPQMPELIDVSTKKLKAFEGSYWNDLRGIRRTVEFENDTLWFKRRSRKQAMVPIAENRFRVLPLHSHMEAEFDPAGNIELYRDGRKVGVFDRYKEVSSTKAMLEAYVGTYYSDELEAIYEVRLKDGEPIVYNSRFGELESKWITEDIFVCDWPVGTVHILRDADGNVNGLLMSNSRAFNCRFRKVEF